MYYQSGEEFLNKLYQDLYKEEIVVHTASKKDSKEKKIEKYLERLKRTHEKAKESPHNLDLLKYFYYEKYVIKTLPQNYLDLQKRLAKEEGRSDLLRTEEEMLKQVQQDQKKSIDQWLDYFVFDHEKYPIWFKYYAMRGMLRLNHLDKEKKNFGKRSKGTTEFYIELNEEALAQVYTVLSKMIGKKELNKQEEEILRKSQSFEKLYTHYLNQFSSQKKSEETDGIWKKYAWGSDPYPLWKSLQGKYTGWCTAGMATAKDQLRKGDFYVYYTKDQNQEFTNPRVAIRMDDEDIAEVRGILEHQNLEDVMVDITEKKLQEFKHAWKYKQKLEDMKKLTEIERKQEQGEELSISDLELLYEIHHKVKGFGYQEDPRLEEIRNKRNLKKDLAFIFQCQEENITSSYEDLMKKPIVVFLSNLRVSKIEDKSCLRHLKMIRGILDCTGEKEVSYLSHLQTVSESAWCKDLVCSVGLENLETVNGNLYCNSLVDGSSFEHLKSIGGYVYAPSFAPHYMEQKEFLEKIKEEKIIEEKKVR